MYEIVWESKLDEIYSCKVIKQGGYQGLLTVKNIKTEEFLLEKDVSLAFNSMFGPDIDDIAYWEDLCVAAVDGGKNA